MSTSRQLSTRHSKAAAGKASLHLSAADSDDVEQEHLDQQLRSARGTLQIFQHTIASQYRMSADMQHLLYCAVGNPAGSDSSDDEEQQKEHDEGTSASEDADDEDDDDQQAPARSTAARARSHAAAAPGPGSSSAKASTSKHKGGSKKRAAAVAFEDAISLLPPDLDVEMLVRARQQLQPRNRMQKQALLLSYRQQYQHWRFLLRWEVGSCSFFAAYIPRATRSSCCMK